jgi:uncharacterized membrane protein YbhN (UPF0104 family)
MPISNDSARRRRRITTAANTVDAAEATHSHRTTDLVRRALIFSVSLGVLLALVFAVPSLKSVRHALTAINGRWVAAAVLLELGSCFSFVIVFRAFFDQVPARLARQVAWTEMASGALLPGGGITSYALGGVLLNRAGMSRHRIIVRSGGVFWLTSAANACALIVGVLLLLTHVGYGPHGFALTWIPLLVVVPLTLLIAISPRLAAGRDEHHPWMSAIVDGVADAWRSAFHPSWRLLGAVGYLGCDMAVLLCIFRGLGYHADCGALMLGYLVGYCATIVPIPAGIGVIEGGLGGALILYGTPAAQTVAAVLMYHAIAFWVPSLGGLGAYTALVTHARRTSHAATEPAMRESAGNAYGHPLTDST